MPAKATILNRARLERKLQRMPAAVKAQIKLAMEAQADDIVRMMKSLAPQGKTGALRASIGWTWGAAPKGSMTIASVRSGLGTGLTLTIYAGNRDAYYARWVEFGVAAHENGGMFAGTQNPGTRAQPFFYVSWRANKKRSIRAIRAATRKAVKKVASGG